MCDTVFTLQSLLGAHFDQHVGNHKVSVFKCPDCSMLYAQKQLMLDHIKVDLIHSILLFLHIHNDISTVHEKVCAINEYMSIIHCIYIYVLY